MNQGVMGAHVKFCNHDGWFVADIWVIGNVNVVRASQSVTPDNINRPALGATHHLRDFPKAGFWKPELGVFVVPKDQVRAVIR